MESAEITPKNNINKISKNLDPINLTENHINNENIDYSDLNNNYLNQEQKTIFSLNNKTLQKEKLSLKILQDITDEHRVGHKILLDAFNDYDKNLLLEKKESELKNTNDKNNNENTNIIGYFRSPTKRRYSTILKDVKYLQSKIFEENNNNNYKILYSKSGNLDNIINETDVLNQNNSFNLDLKIKNYFTNQKNYFDYKNPSSHTEIINQDETLNNSTEKTTKIYNYTQPSHKNNEGYYNSCNCGEDIEYSNRIMYKHSDINIEEKNFYLNSPRDQDSRNNQKFSSNEETENFHIIEPEKLNITSDFNNLMQDKILVLKDEMLNFFEKAKTDISILYTKLYEKTVKISNSKARKISQVYNNETINKSNPYPSSSKFKKSYSKEDLNRYHKSQSSNPHNNLNLSEINNLKNDTIHNISPLTNLNLSNILDDKLPSSVNPFKIAHSSLQKQPFSLTYNLKKTHNNNKFSNLTYQEEQQEQDHKNIQKLKNFANKNFIEKINSMFLLHENLKHSIIQNFELMTNFLEQYDLNSNNPLQEYVDFNAQEICNSWILPKVNFKNLNLSCFIKNDEIPKTFKNYIISEDSQNKFTTYSIERTEKSNTFDFDRKILKNNNLLLTKLDLIKMDSKEDLKCIFYKDCMEKLNFEKMKKINFLHSKLDSINYLYFFPNLVKINFKKCKFIEIPTHFSTNFPKLREIIFKKCSLDNESVYQLMSEFYKLEDLEIINFSSNNLTSFNFIGEGNVLKKLHTLILRKNKISRISLSKDIFAKYFPKIEIIDLFSNNLTNFDNINLQELRNSENNKILLFLGKNLILFKKPQHTKRYISHIKDILTHNDYNIPSIDFSYLLYKYKHDEFLNLRNFKFKLNIQMNLKKINLSFNNLNDEDLFYFLSENKGFVNLDEIILKNNNLTENFFELFMKKSDFQNLYEYLKILDISSNKINISCLESLIHVILDNKNLNKINLENNPLDEEIIKFLCNKEMKKEVKDLIQYFFERLKMIKLNYKRKIVLKVFDNMDILELVAVDKKEIINNFIRFK